MAILFMGGEEIDFAPFGTVSVGTLTTQYRTDYARCSLNVNGGSALGNRWQGTFTQSSADFWLGARVVLPTANLLGDPGRPFLGFYDGTKLRLALQLDSTRAINVVTYDDALTASKIASSSGSQPTNLFKLDVQVTYGTPGTIRVFVNQTEVITYTGNNIVRGGSTTLSAFGMASPATGSDLAYWSEVIAAERDTRTLMLKTHVPTSTGSGNQWQGAYTDIDEVAANEADGISTNGVDQVAMFGLSDLPDGNLAIRGFKVSGYAARGETGPSNTQLGVTTNGNTAFSANKAVDTGWTRLGEIWEANPVSGTAWTASEINALQIGVRSRS